MNVISNYTWLFPAMRVARPHQWVASHMQSILYPTGLMKVRQLISTFPRQWQWLRAPTQPCMYPEPLHQMSTTGSNTPATLGEAFQRFDRLHFIWIWLPAANQHLWDVVQMLNELVPPLLIYVLGEQETRWPPQQQPQRITYQNHVLSTPTTFFLPSPFESAARRTWFWHVPTSHRWCVHAMVMKAITQLKCSVPANPSPACTIHPALQPQYCDCGHPVYIL